MLLTIALVLLSSGIAFMLLDLLNYNTEDVWRPINWLATLSVLPFILAVNVLIFIWYLLDGFDFGYAYGATFEGLLGDIADTLQSGW